MLLHCAPILCVVCRKSLYTIRCNSIPPGPERNVIAKQISPREIPPGGLACCACWQYARSIVKQNPELLQQSAKSKNVRMWNTNKCLVCQRSLNTSRRKHNLPPGPVTDEILARILLAQIPEGGLVCYACWLQARRNVERREREREDLCISPNPEDDSRNVAQVCTWCELSVDNDKARTLTHGPIRVTVAARIYPRELPDDAVLCPACWKRADCWTKAQAELDEAESDEELEMDERDPSEEVDEIESDGELEMDEGDPSKEVDGIESDEELEVHKMQSGEELQMNEIEPGKELQVNEIEPNGKNQMDKTKTGEKAHPKPQPNTQWIALRTFGITARSDSHCFVPGCKASERLNVPNNVRRHVLKCKKVFVNSQSRICKEQLMCRNFYFLNAAEFSSIFTVDEAEEALNLSLEEDD